MNNLKLPKSFWLNIIVLLLGYVILSALAGKLLSPAILMLANFSEAHYYAITNFASLCLIAPAYVFLIRRFGAEVEEDLQFKAIEITRYFFAGLTLLAFTSLPLFALGYYQISEIRTPNEVIFVLIALTGQAITGEILFRGLLFRKCECKFGTFNSLLGLSLVLALLNILIDGSNWLVLLTTFMLHIVLTLIYIVSRNIWLAGMFYAGFLYSKFLSGVVDEHWRNSAPFLGEISGPQILTGGNLGPDASVITLITFSLVGVYLWKKARIGKN